MNSGSPSAAPRCSFGSRLAPANRAWPGRGRRVKPRGLPCDRARAAKSADKNSGKQMRCLTRLQRHARAQAWPVRPWPFRPGAGVPYGFTVTGRHQLNGRVRATGLMRFRQRDRATCVAVRDRLTSSRRSPLQFRKHPLVGGDVSPNRQRCACRSRPHICRLDTRFGRDHDVRHPVGAPSWTL